MSSFAEHIIIGVVTGWSTGFVSAKFGPMFGTSVGLSWILFRLANYNGYINLNRVDNVEEKVIQELKKKLDENIEDVMHYIVPKKFQHFARENIVLVKGFSLGYTLGLHCA